MGRKSLETNAVSIAMQAQRNKEYNNAVEKLLTRKNNNGSIYIPGEDTYYGSSLPEFTVSTTSGRGSGTSDTKHPVYESVENQVDPSVNQYRNWIERGKYTPVELANDLDFATVEAGNLAAKGIYNLGKKFAPTINKGIHNIKKTYQGYRSLLSSNDDTFHYTGIPQSKLTEENIINLTDDQLAALAHNIEDISDDLYYVLNEERKLRFNEKGKLTDNIYSANTFRGDNTSFNIGQQMYEMYNNLPINGKISIIQDIGLSRDSYPLFSSKSARRLIRQGKAKLNVVRNPDGTIRMQRLNNYAIDKRLSLSKVINNVRELTGEDVPNYVIGYNRRHGFGYYVPSVELEKLKLKNGGKLSLETIR